MWSFQLEGSDELPHLKRPSKKPEIPPLEEVDRLGAEDEECFLLCTFPLVPFFFPEDEDFSSSPPKTLHTSKEPKKSAAEEEDGEAGLEAEEEEAEEEEAGSGDDGSADADMVGYAGTDMTGRRERSRNAGRMQNYRKKGKDERRRMQMNHGL